MNVNQWKEALLALCAERGGGISFAEVSRLAGSKGDHVIGPASAQNIVYWVNLDSCLVRALIQLKDERQIEFHPASILIYLVDGCTLSLPLAKRARDYARMHWLPVTFNFGPAYKLPPRPSPC